MYTMICTQPYLAFIVVLVSIYKFDPCHSYWKCVRWVLRYLIGTIDYGVCNGATDVHLWVSNIDWVSNLKECLANSNFIFIMKEGVMIGSGRTADYGSTVCGKHNNQEAIWQRIPLIYMEVVPYASNVATLHSDGMSTIYYSKDSKSHWGRKHI